MPELEPITREEKFLNGEVGMTPITREEKILAGEDIETVTRREYFLKKYRGGGGGDVTVVPLSVTDNGTYSEEGKAYSPVSVNVPLPQNAYLLKSVANLPQAIASFNDGQEMVMSSLKVTIEPQQGGSGDPSPENVRPISGWDEVNVRVADDVETPTVENVYTIDLDGTRYGSTLDVINGSGTMNKDSVSLNSIDAFSSDAVNENGYIRYNCGIVGKAHNFNILCDKIKVIQSTVQASANEELISGNANNNKLYFTIDSTKLSGDLSTSTGRSNALKAYLATNDIQVVYELATPLTIQLTPTAVKSLLGSNNVWADTGDIKDAEYFSKEV